MERIAGKVESRVLPHCGLDPGNSLRMTEKVLRHATRPAVDTGQRGGSGHAESRGDFLTGQRDERLVVRGENVILTRPPDEDPDELPPLGSASRPFSGRPGAGQNRAPLGTRDDIPVAIQRVRDLLATVGQGHDGGRCVWDRGQLGGQHGIEIGKEIGGRVCRGGDDDRIRLDRTPAASRTSNAVSQTGVTAVAGSPSTSATSASRSRFSNATTSVSRPPAGVRNADPGADRAAALDAERRAPP